MLRQEAGDEPPRYGMVGKRRATNPNVTAK